mmetsp:Transcript_15390/g.46462  ORF Transcript_15390/g.46462 Transcript_15390/m.46462 type:complete len:179 (+) Transcript_15390:96-632(+)|eukprot:CAMPEP_0206138218 /NCGR_PEP_ID=MMETSP1473-20131121/3158_1 /ASSEMBLY_ACC=CAM_ASM_001109 /TAXON_ID=1461547 /ORGANISM="Stichococcus sp, Strain RCC1054" /LENGTH=178 /DNA_ID=CAMNT_0053531577 /DNA_START=81 /DNA_END=617 /DNA_ORIENTATION=-
MGAVLSVALAVGLPIGISFGLSVAIGHDNEWYRSLKKPSWTPPTWFFGPAWTILYSLMGVSSWIVWKNGAGWVPLTLYGLQLALNLAWTPLFFGKRDPGAALVDITGLIGVLTATIVEFAKVDRSAAMLLVPYLGFTSFATALTYTIWKDNVIEDGKATPKPANAEEAKQAKLAAAGF